MKRFMLGFFQNDKVCGYFYKENNDCNPSPDVLCYYANYSG